MKRLCLLLVLMFTFLTPALAQGPVASAVVVPVEVPLPDNEALVQLAITRPQGQPTAANVGLAWLHNTGAVTSGVVLEVFRRGDAGGAGVGPLFETRIANLGQTRLFFGGDLLALLSGASANSTGAARIRLGTRSPLAKDGHAAARFTIEYWTPVGLKADGQPNDIKQVAALFGVSFGAKLPNQP